MWSYQNSEETIYHSCDDNGISSLNTEEEADVACIHDINETK